MMRQLVPRTMRARLAILFALSTSAILATCGVALHETLKRSIAWSSEQAMKTSLSWTLTHLGEIQSLDELRTRGPASASPFYSGDNVDLAIFDAQGTAYIKSSGFRLLPSILSVQGEATPAALESRDHARRYLVAVTRLAGPAAESVRVAVQYDIRRERAFLRACAFSILVVVLSGTLIGAATAYRIAVFALKPLSQLAARADEISSSRLAHPLPESDMAGELQELTLAFNRMLGRLDDSFARLSQFSSDLAHDIRTPLTNLLAQAQVALSHRRSDNEYRVVIESSVEEYQRLSSMVTDMLFLARADRHQHTLDVEVIDAAAEATRVAGFYEMAADDAGVVIHVDGNAHFEGDRLLVQRALSNLVSNAIAHAPPGSTVRIHCGNRGNIAELSIADTGKGIAPAHLDRIFDRFYRVDAARHKSASGTGLGLAIVKSIMAEHGGECSVDSVPHVRTEFSLRFPSRRKPRDGMAPLQAR